ncbi:MAG: hypothetical protein R2684_16265 [Pyrinomonadaceae bacterium]
MKSHITKLLIGLSALLFVVIAADVSNAQNSRRARGRQYTKADVDRVIKRVEERMDNFVGNFDKSLDNSNLDGSDREDQLNAKAKALESATDELRREFDKRDAWIENKDEVRRCLNLATDLDKTMKARKLGGVTESNWAKVRYELNTLAGIYNLPKVGNSAYK